MAVGKDDRIYLADSENNAILVYSFRDDLSRLAEDTIHFREEWGDAISISYSARTGLIASATRCERGVGGIL